MTADYPDVEGDMHRIHRLVVLDAIPAVVELRLEHSVWAPALSIEPRGSGCSVLVAAAITPAGLGKRIEQEILASVLRSGHDHPAPTTPTSSPSSHHEGHNS